MGRSNREQASMNRERVVAETDAALRRGGVAAVSIGEIMARAALTPGGFYKQFASKDALIVEACTSAFERSVETWKGKADVSGVMAAGALRRLAEYYFSEKPLERSCPITSLGQDAAEHRASAELNAAYSKGVEELFDTFSDIAHQDPKSPVPEGGLEIAFAAMVGANMLSHATGDPKWIEAAMRSVFAQTPHDRPG